MDRVLLSPVIESHVSRSIPKHRIPPRSKDVAVLGIGGFGRIGWVSLRKPRVVARLTGFLNRIIVVGPGVRGVASARSLKQT